MSVVVNERPHYGETVRVRTWPRGTEKLFAIRDYEIRDSKDKQLVQARSCWLIIDVEKRRPLRPHTVADKLPLNEGWNSLPSGAVNLGERFIDLKEQQNLVNPVEFKAAYSDLDYNGHVNNVSYIRWIQDATDPALLENAAYMRLDINYLNEILPAETLNLWTRPIKGETYPNSVADASPDNVNTHEIPYQTFAFEGRKTGDATAFRAELQLR